MKKARLEAFSDGVLAIIITIMVLEFKIPKGNSLHDLKPIIPLLFVTSPSWRLVLPEVAPV